MAKKIPKIIKEIKKFTPMEINYATDKMISYSQFSMYKTCAHKWALTYKDKNKLFSDSIHTVFGTAMHETMQGYITVMYNESGANADKMDLLSLFQ